MDTLQGFGARLKRMRHDLELSQREVAEHLGVKPNTFATWEQEKGFPRLTDLVNLADFFGASTDEILGRAVAPPPSSVTERGITWRFAWAPPGTDEARATAIWHRIVAGEACTVISNDLGITEDALEEALQKLVLNDRVFVEKVKRNTVLEERLTKLKVSPMGLKPREIRVAQISHIHSPLVQQVLLGNLAKEYFCDFVRGGDSIGICGGLTVSRMIYALRRGECPPIQVHPVVVSPMLEQAGLSANNLVGMLAYRHFDKRTKATATQLPFPPDAEKHAPTATITDVVLSDARNVDFLFMGIGAPGPGALTLDIADRRHDFLWAAGIDTSRIQNTDQFSGNIMYHLLNKQGEPPQDAFADENQRMVCSIGLDALRHLVLEARKRVVVIALGTIKAPIVLTAINVGYANVLIIDDTLAEELIVQSGI